LPELRRRSVANVAGAWGGRTSIVVDNALNQQFDVEVPDKDWVTGVILQALLMAVSRCKPKGQMSIHSDQSSQLTRMDWASFVKHHNLVHSMSRRVNCHDNPVAESFFNLLERERIRRRGCRSRNEAR
jgi:putative transposase